MSVKTASEEMTSVKMTSKEMTSVKTTSVKKKHDKLPYVRNFGHIIIYWKIKNFSLAICNSGTEICTDEFEVTCTEFTRWQLGFRVESDGSMLRFFLRRIGGEQEDSFKVSWKIMILNGKNETTFVSLDKTHFVKDSENTIAQIPPFEILRLLPAEKSDEVNIEFQMIVLMNAAMFIPTPRDIGIVTLVQDMMVISKEGLLYDLNLMLNGKFMKVHKAVVSPRSKKLCPKTGYQSKKLNLYLSETDSINCLICYLYTGDLKLIFDPPQIPIYDYIIQLDIKELKNAYPQEKLFLETAAEATNYEFRWIIKDFNCSDELRESEIYEADGTGVKWQLRIYPKEMVEETEMMKSKYFYIEALAVSSDKPQDIFVNFIAKNDKGMITVAKRAYGKVTSGTKLGVFFMRIGSPSVAKTVVDNVFDIIFEVHTATGEIHSKIIKAEPPVSFTLTNFDTYKIMTNYMGLQQSDSTYSDITLVVQDQEIKAHKFLLAGRSEVFSRMVEGMKDDNTLPLYNIHKHVFRVFLEYLYTATVTDMEINVLIHLHDIARHFQVKCLQKLCVKHLAEQLTTENCCYILMFAVERKHENLKTNILNYFSEHREIIIHTEGWRRMEEKNRNLFYEVVCYLGDQPVTPASNVQR